MTDEYFDDPQAFDLERAKLARRRKIAEGLVATASDSAAPRMMGNWVMNPGAMGGVASAIQRGLGEYDMAKVDDQEKLLGTNEARTRARLLEGIPTEQGQERQKAQLNAFQSMPSLRDTIKVQLGIDEATAKRVEEGEQKAADRVEKAEEAERKRVEEGEQKAADRVAREDLRQMPTIHITNSGGGPRKPPANYQWNDDGTALEPIPGGPADKSTADKPLSPAQEKAALALGSERGNLKLLIDSFKDEYSGDIRSSVQREFGKAAGGLAPKGTQEMARWWADQAMFDELPKRHELFGATLTGNEQKAWRSATISPDLAPSVIRERLSTRQKIIDDASARMRASAVAGGKSGKQFDAATGAAKAVVREVKLKDGRIGVEYSDGSRGYKQ